MARAEASIDIAIRGMNQVNRLTQKLNQSSNSIDRINKLLAGKKGRGSIFADYLHGVKLSVRSTNSLNKNLNLATTNFNKVALGTKSATIAAQDFVRANRAVADGLRERNKLIAEAERTVSFERFRRGDLSGDPNAYSFPIGPRPKKGTKTGGSTTGNLRSQRTFGNATSSALIGGAFPLLFGQTGAAAVGGGVGGLAGGLIGGQFGFALSIVGTAIGSAIDRNQKFNESLAVLNARFSTAGNSSKLIAKDIDELAKRFRVTKEEAFGLLEGFKEFDNPRLRKSLVEVFGSDSGAFQALGGSNRQAKLAQQIFEARKQIGDQQATQLLRQNLINGAEVIELALIRAKIKARQRDQLEQAKQIKFLDRVRGIKDTTGGSLLGDLPGLGVESIVDKRVKALEKKFAETEDQTIKDTIEGLKILREQLSLVNEAQGQFGQSGVLAFSAIKDQVKNLNDEMVKLQNPIFQVLAASEAIATSFSQSFKDIIRGTRSVQQAFADMFQRIGDHFLDMAARMIANSVQRGILGLFSNAFTGNIFSPGPSAVPFGSADLGLGSQNFGLAVAKQGVFNRAGSFKAFQYGGVVSSPTLGMIGEGGEPEYVIPSSKMSGAMARYSAGARGGAVIPGGSGASGTVAGTSGNTIVEYTGPVLNFNGDEYVPKSAVPEIINTAAKRGGESGRAQAFSALKNSRSQRATLGL